MSDDKNFTEEDLAHIAKVVGISITPENTEGIIAVLQDLRNGVMQKDKIIPDDTTPATVFDARWED